MDPSQGPASPLDYRRVPPTRRQIFSWPVFIVGICVILILFGVFGFLFPKIEALYADFGVWLPLPTRVVLDVARFMQMRGLVMSSSLPLALGFLVPFALGRRKSPLTRRQWWIIVLVIANIVLTAALVLIIIVWVVPMYRLIKSYFH